MKQNCGVADKDHCFSFKHILKKEKSPFLSMLKFNLRVNHRRPPPNVWLFVLSHLSELLI